MINNYQQAFSDLSLLTYSGPDEGPVFKACLETGPSPPPTFDKQGQGEVRRWERTVFSAASQESSLSKQADLEGEEMDINDLDIILAQWPPVTLCHP